MLRGRRRGARGRRRGARRRRRRGRRRGRWRKSTVRGQNGISGKREGGQNRRHQLAVANRAV